MSPESTPWRHPDSVSEQELSACIERIKSAHDAAPDAEPRQKSELWADICQLMAYIALKNAIENERRSDFDGAKANRNPCFVGLGHFPACSRKHARECWSMLFVRVIVDLITSNRGRE